MASVEHHADYENLFRPGELIQSMGTQAVCGNKCSVRELHLAHGSSFRLRKLALSTETHPVYGNLPCLQKPMPLAETNVVYGSS